MVGDSLAYSLGLGLMDNEQHYGVEVANAGILGCAFTTTGELDAGGEWQPQSAGCPTALEQWSRNASELGARAVVVELGYRDQFDWKINGKVVHLGERAFDDQVADRSIATSACSAGRAQGRVPLDPLHQPSAEPDGSPSPAASPARYRLINQMIQDAARGHSNVTVVDLDKKVSARRALPGEGGRPGLPVRRHPLQPVLLKAPTARRAERHAQADRQLVALPAVVSRARAG